MSGAAMSAASMSAASQQSRGRSQFSAASARLVHHALEVVESAARGGLPAAGYTPLVIVGPAGVGKSSLVAAMFVRHGQGVSACERPCAGQTVHQPGHHSGDQPGNKTGNKPGNSPPSGTPAAAMLWDGRTLGREIALALSHDTLHRLRERFAAPRLVIIDAVEQITAWDVQRALAQLIDMAVDRGTSFVVTMRAHPMACATLEPSLASRLAGGLVVPLPPAGTPRGPATADAAPAPSLRRIINASARLYGLAAADLTGPSRRRQMAWARGVAMYLARTLTGQSLQSIGRAFGDRDHTTVLHGIRVTEERRSRDPAVAAEIERLVHTLGRP
jgi:chromosomal replication initiation ATPase DnaA